MKNYRKAKPGDVICRDCKSVREPLGRGQRFRCFYYKGHSWRSAPPVSQIKTCDSAEPRKGDR